MRLISFFTILIVFASIFSCTTKPQPKVKIIPPHFIEVTGNYQRINEVKNLPKIITDYFIEQRFDRDMVGTDGEFNGSRGTKLISAGNAEDIWFIEFLIGGTGVSQTFLAFRVKDERILSVLELDPNKIYPKPYLQLTIEELKNKLPTQPICVKKHEDYLQYIYEVGYKLCPEQFN